MTFKIGNVYKIKTNYNLNFTGILVESKNRRLIFKTVSEHDFNENIYCMKEEVVCAEKLDKKSLFYYMNSKDQNLINEIFNSLKK